MSEVEFSGTVERVEKDGFGIVRFDRSIGGAEFGYFTTERTENLGRLLTSLDVGTTVVGVCRDEGGDVRPLDRIGLAGPGAHGEREVGTTATAGGEEQQRPAGVRSSWW